MAIAIVTYKQGLRLKAFAGVLVMTLLLFVFSGAISNLAIGDIFKVTQDVCLAGLSFLGLFIAIFLSTQLISSDIEKKTIHLVLSKPIARWHYIIGKFTGFCLLTLASTLLIFMVLLGVLFYFRNNLPVYHTGDIHLLKYLVFFAAFELKLFLIIAIGIFFSSFASTGLISLFFTFVTYLVGSNLQNVKFILESNLGKSISTSVKIMFDISYWLVPNLSLLDMKDTAVHNLTVEPSFFCLSMTYGILYTVGLLLVTCFIFNRREFL